MGLGVGLWRGLDVCLDCDCNLDCELEFDGGRVLIEMLHLVWIGVVVWI